MTNQLAIGTLLFAHGGLSRARRFLNVWLLGIGLYGAGLNGLGGGVDGRNASTAGEARLSSADRMRLGVLAQTSKAVDLAALLAAKAATARVLVDIALEIALNLLCFRCPGHHLLQRIGA
jgi:hypothetical protein